MLCSPPFWEARLLGAGGGAACEVTLFAKTGLGGSGGRSDPIPSVASPPSSSQWAAAQQLGEARVRRSGSGGGREGGCEVVLGDADTEVETVRNRGKRR